MQLQKLSQQSKRSNIYLYRPYDGEKVDIWSAGIILYALLEGTLPFASESTNVLFKMIEKAEYVIDKTKCEEAKDLINRMLQPNPLKRITMEEIKCHPWFLKNLDKNVSFKYM
jgi:serine/threonine protein kinase